MEVVIALHLSDLGELEYEVLRSDTMVRLAYLTSQDSALKFCYVDNDYEIKEWV